MLRTGVGLALTLAAIATCSACFPPMIGEGETGDTEDTEDTSDDFETGDLSGDGDGDPGDGDGDSCSPVATVDCTDGECWASEASWTAQAQATESDHVIEPGLWVPVGDLGTGGECWELWGVGTHVCVVETCGARLLGHPADEMDLAPDDACDFTGVWDSTMGGDGECYGVIAGVAVELRVETPTNGCSFPLAPCPNNDCGVDGRRNLSDMDCGVDGCLGLWSGTDVWSTMILVTELMSMPTVDPVTVWDCDPAPDADLCVNVGGSVFCYRLDGEFATTVQPSCAVSDDSVDVGNGMCSASDGVACDPGTSDCTCSSVDLDGNGVIPFGGECYDDLTCIFGLCEEPEICMFTTECDGDTCWAKQEWWSAWAEYADPTVINDALVNGVIVPTNEVVKTNIESDCYDVVGEPGKHVCVSVVDCVPLFGRPAQEEDGLSVSDCAVSGPWTHALLNSSEQCMGVFGGAAQGFAVKLRAN
jgi:hypothetical protein